jgi:hypothetical protein
LKLAKIIPSPYANFNTSPTSALELMTKPPPWIQVITGAPPLGVSAGAVTLINKQSSLTPGVPPKVLVVVFVLLSPENELKLMTCIAFEPNVMHHILYRREDGPPGV